MKKITAELLELGKSKNGAWSVKQFASIGLKLGSKGWIRRALGTPITDKQHQEFIDLKDAHLIGKKPKKKKFKPKKQKHKRIHLRNDYDNVYDKAIEAKTVKLKEKPSLHRKKYLKYLRSMEWAQVKIDLFEHRGKKCEKCGNTNNVQVHHLTYKNIFKEEPEDLEILCGRCHRKEHKKK